MRTPSKLNTKRKFTFVDVDFNYRKYKDPFPFPGCHELKIPSQTNQDEVENKFDKSGMPFHKKIKVDYEAISNIKGRIPKLKPFTLGSNTINSRLTTKPYATLFCKNTSALVPEKKPIKQSLPQSFNDDFDDDFEYDQPIKPNPVTIKSKPAVSKMSGRNKK